MIGLVANEKRKTCDFKRVYVWEVPVRFFHWLNALAITILVITGFIIADPPAIHSSSEATNLFLFGYVRMIHFVTAYVFVANLLFRVYWAFVGNEFAHARNFFPLNKKGWKNIMHVFKVDILLQKDKSLTCANVSIGHNAVAGLSYFGLFILLLTQTATGFALMAPTSEWWLPNLFTWVTAWAGNDITVRYVHHFVTWLIMIFAIVHMYLVFFHDYLEGRGESSSMVSGFKFVFKKRMNKEFREN